MPTFRAWSRKTPTPSPNTWARTAAPKTATECLDLNLQRYVQVMTYLYGHFYQLVGIHKSCNMIGQDQCSKNDTKAVPNNFCPKSAEYLHDYCTSEGMTTYTLPIPLTFDLSYGLLHPPPSSFWALETSVLFYCAFFSFSFLMQSIFMYSVT